MQQLTLGFHRRQSKTNVRQDAFQSPRATEREQADPLDHSRTDPSISDFLCMSTCCTGNAGAALLDWVSVANFAQVYGQPL